MNSIIGTTIGNRYRILELLGEGADKQVYLATDSRLYDARRAVAVMIDSISDSEKQKSAAQAFEREAEMLTRLKHPRIPLIYDRFSEGNFHYLVMEFIEGETLRARLQRVPGNHLPEMAAVRIAMKVLAVLDYLHRQTPPVIFRDLKPENIILQPDGELKLIDFGIARFFRPAGSNIGQGTVGYAAPEQYQGVIDARSDIYALGATLHYMLTGRDPAQHPLDFPQMSQLAPGCEPNLAACIDSALERDPFKRPQSAAEFRERMSLWNSSRQSIAPDARTIPLDTVKMVKTVQASQVARGATSRSNDSAQASRAKIPNATIGRVNCAQCGAPVTLLASFCTKCGSLNKSLETAQEPKRGKEKTQTPWRNKSQFQYAGFWRRAAAFGADISVLSFATTLLLFLFHIHLPVLQIGAHGSHYLIDLVIDAFLISLIELSIMWPYFTIFESSVFQCTPGKLIFGCQVTDLYTDRITFGKANVRYWSKLLSACALTIGYLMAEWTMRKQALHDKIAETLVISRPVTIGLLARIALVVLVLVSDGVMYRLLVSRNSFLRASDALDVDSATLKSPAPDSTDAASAPAPRVHQDLINYAGTYPFKNFLELPEIMDPLKKVLGRRLSKFTTRIETVVPMKVIGRDLFASGCRAHDCGDNEACLSINVDTGETDAAIFENGQLIDIYSISARDYDSLPLAIRNWVTLISASSVSSSKPLRVRFLGPSSR